jgi:hypothetical protein
VQPQVLIETQAHVSDVSDHWNRFSAVKPGPGATSDCSVRRASESVPRSLASCIFSVCSCVRASVSRARGRASGLAWLGSAGGLEVTSSMEAAFKLIDVGAVACNDDVRPGEGRQSLYFDKNHFDVTGAMRTHGALSAGIHDGLIIRPHSPRPDRARP